MMSRINSFGNMKMGRNLEKKFSVSFKVQNISSPWQTHLMLSALRFVIRFLLYVISFLDNLLLCLFVEIEEASQWFTWMRVQHAKRNARNLLCDFGEHFFSIP